MCLCVYVLISPSHVPIDIIIFVTDMEIVVNGSTGLLYPAAKEGVTPLANNIVKLATHVERRLTMGKKGYERVKERFLEPHMSHRIALVLEDVLQKAKSHST